MNVQFLLAQIALHIRDDIQSEYTTDNLMLFLNSAAWDLRDGGWLLRMEDDESITVTTNTSEYDLPRDFAYVKDIWMARTINGTDEFTVLIPGGQWDIRLNDGKPKLFWLTQSYLQVGKLLKIVGQKRPTIYSDINETVDPGLASKLRERVVYYALMGMAPGNSELAKMRFTTAVTMRQLDRPFPPKAFRQLPGSKIVPGRE